METVACILCGKSQTRPAFVGKDRLEVSAEPFHIVQCRNCGLLYLNPRPTSQEMGRYYPYDRYKEFAPAVEDDRSAFARLNGLRYLDRLCRAVLRVKKEGQLLDVGCATGNFLNRMRRRGSWGVRGVEVNEDAARYAQSRFELDVFVGELAEAGYPNQSFDVVTLWNVLEHLHAPGEVLREIRRVLKDDGVLILSIPNLDSLDAKLFRNCWIGLDPPRHLYAFSPSTVSRLLGRAGLQATEMRSIMGSYHSFTASLQSLVSRTRWTERRKATLGRIILSLPAHVLLLPYLRATEWLKRGAILTVYARKVPEQEPDD